MIPERVAAAIRAGRRPVCAYVYDPDIATRRIADLRAALPAGTRVLYAVKANSNPDLVRAIATHADGLEVASGGELDLALAAGAQTIAFAGPAKTDDELRAAVAADAMIHVESAHELRRLTHLARGHHPRTALRVNRAADTPSGSHRMTGTPTPFGIAEDDLDTLPRDLPISGFHLHAVSNNLDAAAHARFVDDAVAWSLTTARRLGITLTYVNAGGGLGIDYTGDTTFDLNRLRITPPPAGVTLTVEPGRWIAADTGWYAAEVIDLKRNHGRWFAVLRGGTHHFRLPAAWGYSHPFTVLPVDDWPHPYARPEVSNVDVDATGELCTPRDVLTRAQHVDRLRVGDVLVYARTGAYGWDISHHDFLRHPYPEVTVLPPVS
ncbi:type III PLP-dependent enzyme [Asanoa siamensis]|uniref:Staphyloferrin B biosynthesis decarboxylase SbnH n=1 Tax=Asanoa siamensis TaxID=926357 RepID=A0ABQ4CXV8_9ACTN|nr:type III PLP-dependent enzyme [Asanoa siamensis]GIF76114.1 staphyloferrin B biosynthesis decarboxylase SbnH [Asanoa siamensis]